MHNSRLQKVSTKFLLPVAIVIIAALMRLVPHPANVAPIAAMALFGGVYLDKKYAVILPLGALFISDIFLGFYQSMPYVYGSFILTAGIGMWLRHHKSIYTVATGSVLSSVLFFLVTNFGFWLAHSLYPKTFAGQMDAYLMAIPFFRNTLTGDLFYTILFFGGYELLRRIVWNAKFKYKNAYENIYQNRG
jgi:hypothetical protein